MGDGLQNNSIDVSVKNGIQRVLKFTNAVDKDEDLIIEDCSIFKSDLKGYYIVLPRSKFKDMCFLITKIYVEQEKICYDVFNNGGDDSIVQLCKIFAGELTYTEQFIRLSNGLDKLICEIDHFTEDDLVDYEEDPEVIKELQEQIETLKKDKEELVTKHNEETSALKMKLAQANEKIDECEKPFKDLEFEDDDLSLCMEVINDLNEDDMKDLIVEVLASRAGDEEAGIEPDLKVLSLYINDLAEGMSSLGFFGDSEVEIM